MHGQVGVRIPRGEGFTNRGEGGPLRFAILGPVQVLHGGVCLDPGPFKQRVLLAALLCRPNTVMSVEQLVDAIWGDEPPRTARKNLLVYVSALRKITGNRIQRASYGYSINVPDGELDLLDFNSLTAAGQKACQSGDQERARALFGEAVSLWRDQPMVDLMTNAFIAAEAEALTERHLSAYEDWAGLEIRAGRHLDMIEPLGVLARRHPFRERLAVALMTALNQAGNRSEALARYEEHRQLMARDLGLEPSPVVQALYHSVLAAVRAPDGGTAEPGPGGQTATPAWARTGVRPAQLPRDLPDFTGRGEHLAALLDALTAGLGGPDAAVISGPTGAGKTALALHAGHLLASRFTDGQLFVPLRDEDGWPRPWRAVLSEMMQGAGLGVPLPAEENVAIGLWRSWLADRRFLFVLDDAPDEASVRRLLPGRGANATIVTSTRTLGALESVARIRLGEFSHAEVLEVLRRALGTSRTLDAGDAITRIITRCGAHPLVIQVITAKLTVLPHLSMRDWADRLDRAADVLDELTVGDMSVRARLDRFQRGLAPPLSNALHLLGALPEPPFSPGDLHWLLDRLAEPAGPVIEDLIEANLLAVAEGSYLMPIPAFRYACTLRSSGLATTRYSVGSEPWERRARRRARAATSAGDEESSSGTMTRATHTGISGSVRSTA
jgi:DNA-binding SARP family transcriptional activator